MLIFVPAGGVPGATGGYGPEAMAALGASLAVLLAACLLVIGLLLCHMKKSKADWRKMTEANVFRSSVSPHATRFPECSGLPADMSHLQSKLSIKGGEGGIKPQLYCDWIVLL